MTARWIEKLRQGKGDQKILEQERLLIEATEIITRLLVEQGMTRSDLARRLDSTPAYVTKVLRGGHNFTLKTLSDVLFELGKSVHLSIGEIGESISNCPLQAVAPVKITSKEWPQPGWTGATWTCGIETSSGGDSDVENFAA